MAAPAAAAAVVVAAELVAAVAAAVAAADIAYVLPCLSAHHVQKCNYHQSAVTKKPCAKSRLANVDIVLPSLRNLAYQ